MFDSRITKMRQLDQNYRIQIHDAKQARQEIGDRVLKARRAMSDTEREAFVSAGSAITRAEAEIVKNSKALLAAEADEQKATIRAFGGDADGEASRRAAARAGLDVGARESRRPAPGRRFSEMFGSASLQSDGWDSAEEFLSTLHQGRSDKRLRASFMPATSATAVGNVGSDGGYAVPTEYAATWLDDALESEIVRPRATIWPMASNTRRVPAWDASDSSSSLLGGFSAQWVEEAAEISLETPQLRMVDLTARKLGLLTQVSNELLRDGLNYGSQLGDAITQAISFHLDEAFLVGSGAPGPLGVVNAPATISVTAEVGQDAATIVYSNLTKMFARMHPASLGSSVWVASSTTIPQLSALNVTIGTGGSHVPVMTETDGTFRILTRPVFFTEKVPTLGTVGDIGLYDFSKYAVGMRQDFSLDQSQHVGFSRDTAYFRGLLRVDGQPTWAEPYQPKNGDTLSPFVTLATRS